MSVVQVKYIEKEMGNCSICNDKVFGKYLNIENHSGKRNFRFCSMCAIDVYIELDESRKRESFYDD